MRILHLITLSSWGGAQRYVYDLVTHVRNGYVCEVAAGGDGELMRKLKQAGIQTHRLQLLTRFPNPVTGILAILEIRSLLQRGRYEIVHLSSTSAAVLGSIAAYFTRPRPTVIYTLHGAAFWNQPGPAFVRWIFFFAEKFTAPLKHFFIFVTDYEAKLWIKKGLLRPERARVVRNGIDINALSFLEKNDARGALAGIIGRPLDGMLIGTISNLFPKKGIEILVEAAALLRKKRQQLLVLVIGEGVRRKTLEQRVAKLDLRSVVMLPGSIPYAARYLKAFDIFVLPSAQEALPYSILEAMAAGLPIVATHVGGIPEMIRDREEGLLVPPKDPRALAEAIELLIEDAARKKNLGEKTRERVQQEFTLERMIEETIKVYELTLNKSG